MDWMTDALKGSVDVEMTGMDTGRVLNTCAEQSLRFWKVKSLGEYTVRFCARPSDAWKICNAAERGGCEVRVFSKKGAPAVWGAVRRRYALIFGALACLTALFWSSIHVWKIDVRGNETVPTYRILNALEDNGVGIGSLWPFFSNDLIQAGVLLEVPELSVAAIQVHGSRVEVVVRERIEKPKLVIDDEVVEIIASKSGLVTSMSVLRGDAAVKKGDTVLKGETLVLCTASGRIAQPRPVHAMAEVWARTWYEITAETPLVEREKKYTGRKKEHFSLVIGKTRINFYRNSGISMVKCDKITNEYKAAVKNVFMLPLTLVRETYREYETTETEKDIYSETERLKSELVAELLEETGSADRVVSSAYSVTQTEGKLCVTLRAECIEDIALPRPAEYAGQENNNIQGEDQT